MSDNSKIEWTDATWNPTVGCSVVSPGCTNCYAMKLAARLEKAGSPIYRGLTEDSKAGAVWNGKVEASNWGQMIKPLSWKRPRRVFVNSMSDLFHEALPDHVIDQVFAVMALCPQHTFQVLTKRPERMLQYLSRDPVQIQAAFLSRAMEIDKQRLISLGGGAWPLPNVWLGTSCENQDTFNDRWPPLRDAPAAIRFLSLEPLLEPIDIGHALLGTPKVDWVIVGGESGPRARMMQAWYASHLLDDCMTAEVPFFMKQMAGKKPIPPELLVREFPAAR